MTTEEIARHATDFSVIEGNNSTSSSKKDFSDCAKYELSLTVTAAKSLQHNAGVQIFKKNRLA
jgi:hypothetical protein